VEHATEIQEKGSNTRPSEGWNAAGTIMRSLLRGRGSKRRFFPLIGGLIVSVFILVAVLGEVQLTSFKPDDQNLSQRLKPPGSVDPNGGRHWLGTDPLGRDVLARLATGTRVTFAIAALSVITGTIVGSMLGLCSGYLGGWLDDLVMRLVDLQMAFPFVFVAIAVVGLFGPGFSRVVLALVTWGWVAYARMVRASTLGLREREFVIAARALGGNEAHIIFRHVLPNLLPLIIVIAATQVGRMIVAHAGLEFLGLGLPPPHPTWGGMLSDGRSYIATAWWVTTFPGLAITVLVVAISFVGDAVRDRLLGEEV
jgi:peptide/nickel transport system permease protein